MSETDSISVFLRDIEYHGRNERTEEAYRRVLLEYKQFIETQFSKDPTEVEYRECMAWIHELRSVCSESTVATYASYLNRFYSYLERVGHHDHNPMTMVIEEMNESIDTNPSRRNISISEMQAFVAGINHPLHRAIIITLLKTGMRAGELCNLDLKDVNLNDESQWWTPRAQFSKQSDAIYISPEHTYGQVSGGERRFDSNKRKRETIVPVDGELRDALIRWLSIRPDTYSAAEPLFTGTVQTWGERLSIDIIHHIVEQYAREEGWYTDGAGAEENVTPHYFRHFFTTHLRDRTGDRGIVKYLRGDVADDIIDTYTHNWGDRVRDTYEQNIYSVISSQT